MTPEVLASTEERLETILDDSVVKSSLQENEDKEEDEDEEEHVLGRSDMEVTVSDNCIATSVPASPKTVAAAILKGKSKELERQLKAKHCRPLIKLFKMLSSESFSEKVGDSEEEAVSRFLEQTKQQLQAVIADKVDASKELSDLIKQGDQDQLASVNKTKQYFEGITCQDLE